MPAQKRELKRNYIGLVSDEEQGRRDSLRDLRDAMRRKSGIVLVDDRDHAQVVVEVIGREKREGAQGGFGGRPHQIRITDLMEQVEEERWVREAEVVADLNAAAESWSPVTTAVVA